jgi:hypothetical protein
MKLQAWMTRENIDDSEFARRMEEQTEKPCSDHTVAKWRRLERIPRPASMAAISVITGQEVTANDFVPDAPPTAPDQEPLREAVE